eukprot:753587-Hanusia_phi.AAC.1
MFSLTRSRKDDSSELLQSDLFVYPVNAKSVRQYLNHQQANVLHSKQATGRVSHAMLKTQRKSRVRNSVQHGAQMRVVPASQSQMLSDDVEALDGSKGIVHAEPLEDPTMEPENVYTVAGTSFPTNLNLVAPTQYSASSQGQADEAQSNAGASPPPPDSSNGSGGRPCEGPVRHTDTDDCVAKKAMAQALQAEKDVMSVDSNIDETSKHISSVERWEEDEHDTIKKDLTRKFHALDRLLRKQDRLLDRTDRRITNGDQVASSKVKLFKNDEIQHVESIINRAERLESEGEAISHMRGPPGFEGPPGLRGAQGAQGIQGPRGPPGDEGLPGEVGRRGRGGSPGLEGRRGPAGHYAHLRVIGAQSNNEGQREQESYEKFKRSLDIMNSIIDRLRSASQRK